MPSSEGKNWLDHVIEAYRSGANRQFVLYGNTHDIFPVPNSSENGLGNLSDLLSKACLSAYDLILSLDIATGIKVMKGQEIAPEWLNDRAHKERFGNPRQQVALLDEFILYCVNYSRAEGKKIHLGLLITNAQYVLPNINTTSIDVSAVALTIKRWSEDPVFKEYPLATFIICQNLSEIHPMIQTNSHGLRLEIPLPTKQEIQKFFKQQQSHYPIAFKEIQESQTSAAQLLAGTSLNSLQAMLKLKEYQKEAIKLKDLESIAHRLVEESCDNLIEFIRPKHNLSDLYGQAALKKRIQNDLNLWQQGMTKVIPKGYLLMGPVGTGKSFFVEALAGEAQVPVVKLKNFRGKYQGETESNLERIFRLLRTLPRCFVFIDEADQSMGSRDSGASSSPVDARVYSMFAQEMASEQNRGRLIWLLATSRPDLLEVDLKRPGRMDLKIPLLPCESIESAWALIQALSNKHKLSIDAHTFDSIADLIPKWMTPGSTDSLLRDLQREKQIDPSLDEQSLLIQRLQDYQPPVSPLVMEEQTRIAIQEASDIRFVPEAFRYLRTITQPITRL
ncbi:MAG: ATP-binding protein [Verrucomicrobiota bacterium]